MTSLLIVNFYEHKQIKMTIIDEALNNNNVDYILIVGGSNGEYILQLSQELEMGQKHLVEACLQIGGGGVNQTLRLLKAGFSPLPILPIGQDELGFKIQNELLREVRYLKKSQSLIEFVESNFFLISNLKTKLSTIIINGGDRTIFTEKTSGKNIFFSHLKNRIETLNTQIKEKIKAIIIGDIQADSQVNNPQHPGQCTQYLMDYFSNKCLVFANPGKSQLDLNQSFWNNYIKKVNIFQLNIKEARKLFSLIQNNPHPSLREILEWFFQNNTTALVTCDHYGVLGISPNEPNKIIFAPPIKLDKTIDTTGAGDAFGAGLVSQLYQKDNFSFNDFFQAIDEARTWAAYACCHIGGSANCPTTEELKIFKKNRLNTSESLEVLDRQSVKTVLSILDKIYPY